jgi:Secretion system C-terminal sorting domain
MRKFYLSAVNLLLLLLMLGSLNAQYATTASGGSRDITDPLTWVGGAGGIPPFGCNTCTITINGTVNINSPVNFVNSTVLITGTPAAILTVNDFVELFNTNVTVQNHATVFVNDEVHLYGTSNIRLGNKNAKIDASNGVGNPSHGTVDNGDPAGAGIYFSLNPAPPMATLYDLVISPFGYGGPFPPGAVFFDPYTINCDFGLPSEYCNTGVVFGPADIEFASGIWQFVQMSPLPVDIAQFAASLNLDHTVDVSWATSQEINSDYFSVERSADAINWKSIGNVDARGTSSVLVHYTYLDPSPLDALNYYRLKMVDLDGKFKYSKTAAVSIDGKSASLVVYNNPFNDQIRIKINTATSDNLSINLSDMLGRSYSHQVFNAQPGDNFINITPTGASAGLYILNIKGKNYNQTIKLVKE